MSGLLAQGSARRDPNVRTLRVRSHSVRFVYSSDDYGSGCFGPHLDLYLSGPNGSANGSGPKGWPRFLGRRFVSRTTLRSDGRGGSIRRAIRPPRSARWSGTLTVNLPFVPWHFGYRFRRYGARFLERAVYRAYRAADGRKGSGR